MMKNSGGKIDRNIYLNLKSIDEAMAIIENLSIPGLGAVEIDSSEAIGRIASEDIYARFSVPHYNAAAMDGIATKAEYTFDASETEPITLTCNKYTQIDTGQPIPEGYDVVIPEEEISYDNNRNVTVIKSFHPWQNVRIIGEDIVKGELLIPANSVIQENAVPLLLAGGIWKIMVKKKPRGLIIPTGNEIAQPPVEILKDGQIIDYDSNLIGKLLEKWGCEYEVTGVIPDSIESLKNRILSSLESFDFICIIAGSSAGRKDYTTKTLSEIGKILFHGVKMMPGKPFSLAVVSGKPVFGIPGFPASAYFSAQLFLRRYIERITSRPIIIHSLSCSLSQNVSSKLGYSEIIRATVSDLYNKIKAIPLKRGASVFKSIYESSGYFIIPENSEGYPTGKEIDVYLINEDIDYKKNIIFIGSNDLSIDFIKSLLKLYYPDFNLVSLNRGSMGGLVSLKNQETHFAPTHLFDPESNDYNIPYIKKIFGDQRIFLLGVAKRNQGIIVKKGNPSNIKGIEDIQNVRFINRQKGSGTRILLDYLIDRKSIDRSRIKGYDFELYTHMAVCNFIQKGYADCGIGIKTAADAFDLDFIPIGYEEYELAFYESFLNDKRYDIIYKLIQSQNFKDKLKNYGGYDTSITGRIRKV